MAQGSPPSILMELHTADRVVRTLVYEELYRHGLAPNLLSILVLIDLHEPIKALGVYRVPIRLHADVKPEVRVWVIKQ